MYSKSLISAIKNYKKIEKNVYLVRGIHGFPKQQGKPSKRAEQTAFLAAVHVTGIYAIRTTKREISYAVV